jgi:hypothetical protein
MRYPRRGTLAARGRANRPSAMSPNQSPRNKETSDESARGRNLGRRIDAPEPRAQPPPPRVCKCAEVQDSASHACPRVRTDPSARRDTRRRPLTHGSHPFRRPVECRCYEGLAETGWLLPSG